MVTVILFKHMSWKLQPTPVFLPGKSHRQWSLRSYSLWGCKRVGQDISGLNSNSLAISNSLLILVVGMLFAVFLHQWYDTKLIILQIAFCIEQSVLACFLYWCLESCLIHFSCCMIFHDMNKPFIFLGLKKKYELLTKQWKLDQLEKYKTKKM